MIAFDCELLERFPKQVICVSALYISLKVLNQISPQLDIQKTIVRITEELDLDKRQVNSCYQLVLRTI